MRAASMIACSTAVLAVIACSGTAAAQVVLRQRCEPGSVTYETTGAVRQRVSLLGQTVDSSIDQAMTLEVTTGAPNERGEREIAYRPRRLTISTRSGDERLAFDSADPDDLRSARHEDAAPTLRLFAALSEATWSLTVDESLSVREFRGRERVLDGLDPDTARGLAPQFEPEYLRRQAQEELQPFADRPVRPGDRWRRSREQLLEGGVTLRIDEEFRYVGEIDAAGERQHQVDWRCVAARLVVPDPESNVDADAPARDAATQPTIDYGTLRVVESRGELRLSQASGRIESSERHLVLTGPLTLRLGERQIEGTVDLTLDERQRRIIE
ncbi:MAG TPA: hypothetical protein PLI18_02505 [Pirellulaceae bacterium]|nr:hypothetical protein [Pirellulaceae bacterium]